MYISVAKHVKALFLMTYEPCGLTSDQKVAGSNPAGCTTFLRGKTSILPGFFSG